MKRTTSTTGFILTIILFAACDSTKPITGDKYGGSEMLYQYQWDLVELQGQPVTFSGDKNANLLFTAGQPNKISGSTGCNRLNGSFELSGAGFIKFSPLATTRMACPGDTEAKFIEAVSQVNNWSIINDMLLLNNGKILLAKFRRSIKPITTPTAPDYSALDGTWQLNYISGPRIAFEGLYPEKKPQISFKLTVNELGGNTSCNGFSSKIILSGNKINIAEPFAKTMIFCEGGGEETFLNMLKKVNRYSVSANTLTFLIDDVAVMRFAKM